MLTFALFEYICSPISNSSFLALNMIQGDRLEKNGSEEEWLKQQEVKGSLKRLSKPPWKNTNLCRGRF